MIDIRKHRGELGWAFADHRYRQVAEADILRQHGEKGLHHARRKSVANDDTVNVAGIEVLGGGLDAERAQHLDLFAHGDAELWIERTAPRDQHRGILKRVADRQRRQVAGVRAEAFDAAEHGGVQFTHAQRRLQPRDQALDGQRGIGRQRDRKGGALVALHARDHRHDGACRRGDLQTEHARKGFGRRPRLGDDDYRRLDRREGGRRVGPRTLDDREGAGVASALTRSLAG